MGAVVIKIIDKMIPMVFNPIVYSVMNVIIDYNKQNIFIRKRIRDLIFGYKIEMLESIEKMLKPLKIFGIKYKTLANNTFGLLYGRNDTPEGPFEIYTGIGGNSQNLGQFSSWKGKK